MKLGYFLLKSRPIMKRRITISRLTFESAAHSLASAVKIHRRLLLPGLLVSFIAIALPATARADKITMTNELKETVPD